MILRQMGVGLALMGGALNTTEMPPAHEAMAPVVRPNTTVSASTKEFDDPEQTDRNRAIGFMIIYISGSLAVNIYDKRNERKK